jgi:hypothetical protein
MLSYLPDDVITSFKYLARMAVAPYRPYGIPIGDGGGGGGAVTLNDTISVRPITSPTYGSQVFFQPQFK